MQAHALVVPTADAIAAIRGLQIAGVNFVSVGAPWETPDDLRAALRLIAAEVLPAFR